MALAQLWIVDMAAFAFMTGVSTYFRSGNIAVTNARFKIGAQTFAMRGIASVEGVETPVAFSHNRAIPDT